MRYVDPDGREDRYTDNIVKDKQMPKCDNRQMIKLEKVRGIVIHWTGNKANQNPLEIINFWTTDNKPHSAQYLISNKGLIYQVMPETEVAFHSGQNISEGNLYTLIAKQILALSGKSSVNFSLIGIELVPILGINGDENGKEAGKISQQTIDAAVQLTAELMIKYNLNPDTDLYRHYDLTGKLCPLYYVDDKKWIDFKNKVKKEMQILKNKEVDE